MGETRLDCRREMASLTHRGALKRKEQRAPLRAGDSQLPRSVNDNYGQDIV